jgi:hypothetical protein
VGSGEGVARPASTCLSGASALSLCSPLIFAMDVGGLGAAETSDESVRAEAAAGDGTIVCRPVVMRAGDVIVDEKMSGEEVRAARAGGVLRVGEPASLRAECARLAGPFPGELRPPAGEAIPVFAICVGVRAGLPPRGEDATVLACWLVAETAAGSVIASGIELSDDARDGPPFSSASPLARTAPPLPARPAAARFVGRDPRGEPARTADDPRPLAERADDASGVGEEVCGAAGAALRPPRAVEAPRPAERGVPDEAGPAFAGGPLLVGAAAVALRIGEGAAGVLSDGIADAGGPLVVASNGAAALAVALFLTPISLFGDIPARLVDPSWICALAAAVVSIAGACTATEPAQSSAASFESEADTAASTIATVFTGALGSAVCTFLGGSARGLSLAAGPSVNTAVRAPFPWCRGWAVTTLCDPLDAEEARLVDALARGVGAAGLCEEVDGSGLPRAPPADEKGAGLLVVRAAVVGAALAGFEGAVAVDDVLAGGAVLALSDRAGPALVCRAKDSLDVATTRSLGTLACFVGEAAAAVVYEGLDGEPPALLALAPVEAAGGAGEGEVGEGARALLALNEDEDDEICAVASNFAVVEEAASVSALSAAGFSEVAPVEGIA